MCLVLLDWTLFVVLRIAQPDSMEDVGLPHTGYLSFLSFTAPFIPGFIVNDISMTETVKNRLAYFPAAV